jgi:hypothetical protein
MLQLGPGVGFFLKLLQKRDIGEVNHFELPEIEQVNNNRYGYQD